MKYRDISWFQTFLGKLMNILYLAPFNKCCMDVYLLTSVALTACSKWKVIYPKSHCVIATQFRSCIKYNYSKGCFYFDTSSRTTHLHISTRHPPVGQERQEEPGVRWESFPGILVRGRRMGRVARQIYGKMRRKD